MFPLVHRINLGKVERVQGQWVETRFLALGVPLVPLGCYFCIKDGAGKVSRQRIRWRSLSLLAGYMRFGLGLFTIPLLLIVILRCWRHPSELWTMDSGQSLIEFVAGLCLLLGLPAAFILSLTCLGRLSESQRARRLILGKFTGLNADPAIFMEADAAKTLEGLRAQANAAGLSLSAEHWEHQVPSPDSLPLLFTLAMYEKQFPGGEPWKRLAEDFWRMLEQQGHGRS
jgi:hypothetical protein